MNARRFALLLAALLLLAACGGTADDAAGDAVDTADSEPAAAEPATTSEPAAASEPATTSEPAEDGTVTVEVADTDLGQILVDGEGMTLYVFDNDSGGESSCTGDCANTWPPLTAEVSAGDDVDDSLLGTTEREDGTAQVTYDDQPLYYFAGDEAAGDTNGQGVGGIWWVVGPDGQKITGEEDSASLGY